jgi:hypothetical protein
METLNAEIQYPLNSVQLRGIKSIVRTNLEKSDTEIIELLNEYTGSVSSIKDIRPFELDGKPHILVETFDTMYFIKKFKLNKVQPLELI